MARREENRKEEREERGEYRVVYKRKDAEEKERARNDVVLVTLGEGGTQGMREPANHEARKLASVRRQRIGIPMFRTHPRIFFLSLLASYIA